MGRRASSAPEVALVSFKEVSKLLKHGKHGNVSFYFPYHRITAGLSLTFESDLQTHPDVFIRFIVSSLENKISSKICPSPCPNMSVAQTDG